MSESARNRAIEAVWRIESPRLIGSLTRWTRDVGLAEELAQEAFVAALEQWPADGMPDNPGAWLLATARRRAVDRTRRDQRLRGIQEELRQDARQQEDEAAYASVDARLDGEVEDDVLRLLFMACHPVLSADARVAMTLRLLGSLTTAEIARAFLVPESTVAQRIVRAKKALAGNAVAFEVPGRAALAERLSSVLEVIYLVFNEGYSATAGGDWTRPALCEEGIRLGRVLAAAMPDEPEVHGLLALMEIQASRLPARTGAGGRPILLADQNRALWDRLLIRRGLAALEVAMQGGDALGPYTLQAAIAACHARAATVADTDWRLITVLYGQLAAVLPSPVVELNRAIAIAMADGPDAGLARVDAIAGDPALRGYHLLPSVRADLLLRLGRRDEAHAELLRASRLTSNEQERTLLLERAAACRAES